ncbi:HEAT repeat domain-containing protein [Spirillospora sp. NPDC052269]
MAMPEEDTIVERAFRGLENDDASVRLRAAMAVGMAPDPRLVEKLIERSAVEPEFFVRDMLTWALTCHSPVVTVPRLIDELGSENPQARSQALHTLSKVGDRRAWPAITRELLTDADDEVARTAWRTAVVLAPEDERAELAGVLATQLGRGERETQLSLSRALIELGEVIMPTLRAAMRHADPRVRQHAIVTEKLFRDPKIGVDLAIEEAKRLVTLGSAGQEGA